MVSKSLRSLYVQGRKTDVQNETQNTKKGNI